MALSHTASIHPGYTSFLLLAGGHRCVLVSSFIKCLLQHLIIHYFTKYVDEPTLLFHCMFMHMAKSLIQGLIYISIFIIVLRVYIAYYGPSYINDEGDSLTSLMTSFLV